VSIVFLSPTGQIGGAEAALHEVMAGLRDAHPDWPLHLIVASDGPLVARARGIGVSVEVLCFPSPVAELGDWAIGRGIWPRLAFAIRCAATAWPVWAYATALRRRLRALQPTVVHSNGLKMHVLSAWTTPGRAAIVWHFHDYVGRRAVTSAILGRLAKHCSAVVANSESVAQDARRVCGEHVPVYPVWNAVDLTRFAPSGKRLDLDALAELPPVQGHLLRVGLVATFARWKGHRTFLDAMASLPASMAVRGYVIGGPVYETRDSQITEADLRQQIQARGLQSRVGMTGFISDTAAAMRALDVVVHASTDPEPFGLVIVEAMACGKPVIVASAGGAAELADSGVNALTYRPGDAGALARCIEELAGSDALRHRLGFQGRLTAEESFGRGRMISQLTPVYQRVAHVQ